MINTYHSHYNPENQYAIKCIPQKGVSNIINLGKFYLECQGFKKYSIFHKHYKENFQKMKISFNPALTLSIAAQFDLAAKNLKVKETTPSKKHSKTDIIELVKYASDCKRLEIIKKLNKKYHTNEANELGKWLEREIQMFTLSKNECSSDLNQIIKKFWQNCSEKWINQNHLKKYIPDEDLTNRICRLCEKINLDAKTFDCTIFAACYLKIEDNIEPDGIGKIAFNLDPKEYYLVKEPQPNDLIVYLNSDHSPIHFAVFLDSKRLLSKQGQQMAIFEHDIHDEPADSYIIVRKRQS